MRVGFSDFWSYAGDSSLIVAIYVDAIATLVSNVVSFLTIAGIMALE